MLTLLTIVPATLLTTELLFPCFCKRLDCAVICEIMKHCLLDAIQVLSHYSMRCCIKIFNWICQT